MKLPIVEIITAVAQVAGAVVELARAKTTTLDPAITRLKSEDILQQALARARERAGKK